MRTADVGSRQFTNLFALTLPLIIAACGGTSGLDNGKGSPSNGHSRGGVEELVLGTRVLTSFPGLDFASAGTRAGVAVDPTVAAGPSHVGETVNLSVAFFDRQTGKRVFYQRFQDFFAPYMPLGLYDPFILYDEAVGRFLFGILDRDIENRISRFYFAVSNTSNPLDGFDEMHNVDMATNISSSLTFADYPRFGRNSDAYVIAFNMIRFSDNAHQGVQLLSIDKTTVLDADPSTLTLFRANRIGPTNFTIAPATMHGSGPGDPMWLIQPARGPDFERAMRLTRMTDVLSDKPNFSDFIVSVDPYSDMPLPSAPDSLIIVNSALTQAAWRNDRLVTSHTINVAGTATARWYEFDTGAASPTLVQLGEIEREAGTSTYYPAIEIASNGDLGMTFMESSPSEFISVYVTGRKPLDPPGTMRDPILVKAGEAAFQALDPNPHRGADFTGISVDPVNETSFWAINEYIASTARTNWGTWIAEFMLGDTAGAYVVGSYPQGRANEPVLSSMTFRFNEAMDQRSFRRHRGVSSFTGPGGINLKRAITSFHWLSETELEIEFRPQTAPGEYRMTIGPQILRASDGHPMDQNANGVPGENPGDEYTARVYLNCTSADAFGYTACAYPFEPIQLVPGAEGVFTILKGTTTFASVPLRGSSITLYGKIYKDIVVNSRGIITLGSQLIGQTSTNFGLSPMQLALAPLWDDWRTDLGPGGQVLGKFEDLNGDGIDDRLIVEWHEVRHAPAPGSPSSVTFQAILSLNTGTNSSDIVFNYPNVDTGDASANGASAIVGMKDSGPQGDNRIEISYKRSSPFVHSKGAIQFSAPPAISNVSGTVFHDLNRNGERDPDEPGLEGWIVYLDLNQNGIRDPDEPFTISGSDGAYEFTELASGAYAVRVEPQLGWVRSLFTDERILEDFESELMTGYTMATSVGPNTRIAERAAHSGELGLVVAGSWAYRVEPAAQVAQGHKIALWAQLPSIADGGLWFGFGAAPTGTLAIALAPVANQLVIQQGIGYSTQTIGTVPQTYEANTWYRLEVDWQVGGSITGRLFSSDGVTLLNTVTATTQAITAGGLAFSGNHRPARPAAALGSTREGP